MGTHQGEVAVSDLKTMFNPSDLFSSGSASFSHTLGALGHNPGFLRFKLSLQWLRNEEMLTPYAKDEANPTGFIAG